MLRKVNKKAIVAIIMAMTMIVTLTISTSAVMGAEAGLMRPCSHGYRGTYGYQWDTDYLLARAYIDNHPGCTGASLTVVIVLSTGTISMPVTGTLGSNGVWDATLNFTPPPGSTIRTVGVSYRTCDVTR